MKVVSMVVTLKCKQCILLQTYEDFENIFADDMTFNYHFTTRNGVYETWCPNPLLVKRDS